MGRGGCLEEAWRGLGGVFGWVLGEYLEELWGGVSEAVWRRIVRVLEGSLEGLGGGLEGAKQGAHRREVGGCAEKRRSLQEPACGKGLQAQEQGAISCPPFLLDTQRAPPTRQISQS